MRKFIISIVSSVIITTNSFSTFAAEVPQESTPICTTNAQIVVVERLVGNVFDKVINGMGYSDARAESNAIIFNAWLNEHTNGYAFGELVNIANNAIWQYRDMHLRPQFYAQNEERIKNIITDVISDYKSGKIDYTRACFEARIKIYQSINPNFNPEAEYMKDPIYRDIPSVDNSLFRIARKLILSS